MNEQEIGRFGNAGCILLATSFALGFFLCSVGCSQVSAIIPAIGLVLSTVMFLIAYCEDAERKFRQPAGYEPADHPE